ncbi:MAG TPA: TSUP family transporter, partial [Gemmatimonadales bacterium]
MPVTLVLAMLAAALGSGINSIAGGGTLVTFPAIVALGVPPLVANATNTVALWPGALASLWGYRGELAGTRAWLARFTLPSLLGGAVG